MVLPGGVRLSSGAALAETKRGARHVRLHGGPQGLRVHGARDETPTSGRRPQDLGRACPPAGGFGTRNTA
eukprot:2621389-Pyramimonas_sp.AAC.1